MVLGIAGVRCQQRQLLAVQQTGIGAGTPCASGSSHRPQPERMARECRFHSCMLPNKKTLLACCATCGSSSSRRKLRYRGGCSPLARVNAGVHGEGEAKSRRDGGGELGDGARAGVRLETDGHPWSARLPSCAPCLCVREVRRSCDTRLNVSHSSRHGHLRGQQAAGRPHQWHGQAGCTWQHLCDQRRWLSCCGEYEAAEGTCGPSSNLFCA